MRALGLTLAIAALIAVGCGDESGGAGATGSTGGGAELSEQEYGEQVSALFAPLGEELQNLGDEISASESLDEGAAKLNQAVDRLDETVNSLENINPPSGAEEGHQKLIEAINTFNGVAKETAAAFESGDTSQVEEIAPKIQAAAAQFKTDLTDAVDELRDAGITIGR